MAETRREWAIRWNEPDDDGEFIERRPSEEDARRLARRYSEMDPVVVHRDVTVGDWQE